ncbi:MAG: molecular chaperone GrpE [Parcubacteria group bacterium Athens1014_10]|nr:MAG: molecular chaperone GrpE [Parcubacteria group bacterium Athens1014_10]TSD05975.1 MAG: molecular chaperone GrpE [Parcubacteria group bacterium Athens0714_12]
MDTKNKSSFPKAMEDKEIEKLKKELEEEKKKVEEYLNGWKRAQADYANREKEIKKDKENWIKFAHAGLILRFLEIYDHFKQAVNHISEEEKKSEWSKGIIQIKEQFKNLLKSLGVAEIKTVGEKFDLQKHEAIAKEKSEGSDKGAIIKEIQPGYTMNGEVIKPAKVIISE